jgi:hypothetical protein
MQGARDRERFESRGNLELAADQNFRAQPANRLVRPADPPPQPLPPPPGSPSPALPPGAVQCCEQLACRDTGPSFGLNSEVLVKAGPRPNW